MNSTNVRNDICDHLLMRVGKGDREALGEIFQREAPRLIAISIRLVRRAEIAEEVVQDSFIAAWRNAPSFDPKRGHARAWLTTIVRNRSLNFIRNNSRMEFHASEAITHYSDSSDAARGAYMALADSDALKACLEQIEEKRRTSILMAYVLGYSHSEIAAGLKVPVGTVKAWIRRGVIALQECLS